MINCMELTVNQAIDYCIMMIEGMQKQGLQRLSVYLQGEPGVGKSSIPKAVADRMNYWLEDLRPNNMNPDDAAGTRMQDLETGTTRWFPPEWMPPVDGSVEVDGRKYDGTVLLFDELASADDRVRKPLFGAFLDYKLNRRPLPANCIVFAAGNESETGTEVMELDNATRSRFITIRIIPDLTSWLEDYAVDAKVTPTVVATLKNNINRFCTTAEAYEKGMQLYPNPRSWDHASIAERAIMQTDADRRDPKKKQALAAMIAGKIGKADAELYMGVFDQVAEMSNLYDLLKADKKDRHKLWPKTHGQLHALTHSMVGYISNATQLKEIVGLLDDWPRQSKSLPFDEMEGPLIELITRRAKKLDIPEKERRTIMDKATKTSTADVFAAGPIITLNGL